MHATQVSKLELYKIFQPKNYFDADFQKRFIAR